MQPERVPCPSWGAYKRHLRRGQVCQECLDFIAAWMRERRAA